MATRYDKLAAMFLGGTLAALLAISLKSIVNTPVILDGNCLHFCPETSIREERWYRSTRSFDCTRRLAPLRMTE